MRPGHFIALLLTWYSCSPASGQEKERPYINIWAQGGMDVYVTSSGGSPGWTVGLTSMLSEKHVVSINYAEGLGLGTVIVRPAKDTFTDYHRTFLTYGYVLAKSNLNRLSLKTGISFGDYHFRGAVQKSHNSNIGNLPEYSYSYEYKKYIGVPVILSAQFCTPLAGVEAGVYAHFKKRPEIGFNLVLQLGWVKGNR